MKLKKKLWFEGNKRFNVISEYISQLQIFVIFIKNSKYTENINLSTMLHCFNDFFVKILTLNKIHSKR